jgi:hypothetical protein
MTTINSITAATYESNWQNYVNTNTDMRPVFLTGGNLITGISMSYADYMYLIGTVGVDTYKIRFGLDGTALHIMVTGIDVDEIDCTPIYDFTSYTTTTHSTTRFTYSGFIPNMVAPVVIKDKLIAWENQTGTIPSAWFKVQGQVLKGYAALAEDFLYLLFTHTNTSSTEINIVLTKNTFDNTSNDDATVSVAMYSADQDGVAYALDACFPCPKSCGGWRKRK